jgi:SPP1 family phage portal protein
MAIYGVSYEYEFVKKNTNEINVKVINPAHTFIVYDDSIEENPLFAVYYRVVKDDSKDSKALVANIFTQNFIYEYVVKSFYTKEMYLYSKTIPEEHYMGDIPVVEFRNNIDGTGDYEKQMGLIDAYNTLMSDRIDDVEKFVDSVMVIYSDALLQDEGTTNGTNTMALLKREKLLQLSPGDKAEFLTSSLDGEGMETMRKAIKEDIFT